MRDRVVGILAFLPVPIVLALFTRAPLGIAASLVLGTAIMITHRLYARPLALRTAATRCLWCGGGVGAEPRPLVVDEPFGRTTWAACSAAHADSVRGVLGWATARALLVRVGILGSLVAFLALAVRAALHQGGPHAFDDAVALFRLGVAFTVLPLGWLGPSSRQEGPLRPPFPVHIQALVGTVVVVWLFRLVGLVWLVQALLHVVRRLS